MPTVSLDREFFVTGGTIPADAASYVERSADRALLEHLLAGRFCYVLNSRQMGKSSLCVRTMRKLEGDGVRCAFVDLTRIGGKNVSPEQWYAGIAAEIGRALGLRSEVLAHWRDQAHLGPLQRVLGSLREVVLEKIDGKVAIFFDEIDATRSLPFSADEFFAGIREAYNRRVHDPVYERLTFCLLGVAVPSDLINSPASTPFNIGERIYLRDFTLEEAMSLAPGLTSTPSSGICATEHPANPNRSPRYGGVLERIYYRTNGHPYLTQSLCAAAAGQGVNTAEGVDDLVRRDLFDPKARETNINLADVGNRALHAGDLERESERFRADLLSAYERAWRGRPLADDESNRVAALLKLSGLMRSEGNQLTVRNRIYRHVFGRSWIRENMPGQELRRQKRAFWLGVVRTTTIATVVIAIIAALAWNNARLAHAADVARDRAEYEAYVADVNLMRAASDSNDLALLSRLLDETKASPHRGMEWSYWRTALHDTTRSIASPQNVGSATISADGTQIGIQDMDRGTGEIRSLNDLSLSHRINPLHAQDRLAPLGGRFVVFELENMRSIGVRDAVTGRPLFRLSPGNGAVEYFWTSPAGGVAFARVLRDGDPFSREVVVWDGRSGAVRHRYRIDPSFRINADSVSDDGRILVIEKVKAVSNAPIVDYIGGRTMIAVDLQANRIVDSMPSRGVSERVDCSGDGRLYAYGIYTGRLFVRDIWAHRTIVDRAIPIALYCYFSRDDRRLVIVEMNLQAQLLDLPSGQALISTQGAFQGSISPDGHSMAVVGLGTRIYSDAAVRHDTVNLPHSYAAVYGVNGAGNLVCATGQAVRQLDEESLRPLTVVASAASLASVSQDANWLMRATPDGGADIVSTYGPRKLCHISSWSFYQCAMDVSLDARFVVGLDRSGEHVYGYDAEGRRLWTYHCVISPGAAVQWSHAGGLVAVGLNNGDMVLLDGRTGRAVRTLHGPKSLYEDIAFSPDDRFIATATEDFDAYIMPEDGSPPIVARGHGGQMGSVMFSPDGSRLLTASTDGTARLWDARTGRQVLQFGDGRVPMLMATFSRNGDRVFTSDYGGNVRVYRMR